jgi:nucleotide-binding universal stress UspA family protein
MLRKIVVGYDGRPEARDALALARRLARESAAELILAAVFPIKEEPIGLEGYEAALKERSERLFETVQPGLEGIDVEMRALGSEPPWRALRDLAEAEAADAIVLGSTHRGPLGRIYPGAVAERLLHGAPCAVGVAPRGFAKRAEPELRVLAVAFDGSPESDAALDVARDLAEAAGATVRVVAVHEPFRAATAIAASMGAADVGAATRREAMQTRLDEAVAELPTELRPKGLLLQGGAAHELLEDSELGVDLLVMGSRGLGPLGKVLIGGVPGKVVRSAPCPVLVLPKRGARAAADQQRDRRPRASLAG